MRTYQRFGGPETEMTEFFGDERVLQAAMDTGNPRTLERVENGERIIDMQNIEESVF